MLDKFLAEDAHEAGEYDQVRRISVDFCNQGTVVGAAVVVFILIDDHGIYVFQPCPLKAFGIGPVANDCADNGVDAAFLYRVDD